jgi:hypothetical protein
MAEGKRWFSVRIMPYRTLENVIDKVVITFSNITVTKVLEVKLQECERESRKPPRQVGYSHPGGRNGPPGDPGDCPILSANPAFERLFS